MEPILGIDLGTSNSVAAVILDGRPVVVTDGEGNRIQPSVVSITPDGGILVGHPAKRRAAIDPANTIVSAKRLIGRSFHSREVQQARLTSAFTIGQGPGSNPVIICHGVEYTIPEVSGFILRHMKELAEAFLGTSVSRAVVTVPANFNDAQRQSTKLAGRVAGLEVVRILNEPTAAALACGLDRGVGGRVAVYDFGGGTFDITILDIRGTVFQVLATAGDSFLGGDDFDHRLVGYMVRAFENRHGIRIGNDQAVLQRLKAVAEKVKCELSFRPKVAVQVQELVQGPSGPLDLSFSITRQGFIEKCRDIIQRTFAVCDEALSDGGIQARDIDQVVLVGGSTRIPLVREMVEGYFSRTPVEGVNPDEVVAIGAAIHAAALAREVAATTAAYSVGGRSLSQPPPAGEDPTREFVRPLAATLEDSRTVPFQNALLVDVTPRSIGVATVGGFYDTVIERNTPIPVEQSRLFTTSVDDQNTVRLQIYQGESKLAEENTKLGEVELVGLRPAPRGEVVIEVTFQIDTDGIISVRARDRETGEEQSVRLRMDAGFTGEESDTILRRYPGARR